MRPWASNCGLAAFTTRLTWGCVVQYHGSRPRKAAGRRTGGEGVPACRQVGNLGAQEVQQLIGSDLAGRRTEDELWVGAVDAQGAEGIDPSAAGAFLQDECGGAPAGPGVAGRQGQGEAGLVEVEEVDSTGLGPQPYSRRPSNVAPGGLLEGFAGLVPHGGAGPLVAEAVPLEQHGEPRGVDAHAALEPHRHSGQCPGRAAVLGALVQHALQRVQVGPSGLRRPTNQGGQPSGVVPAKGTSHRCRAHRDDTRNLCR
ncbi:hypothetical protein KNE206_77910 [Kitasatospora sp. NE20-6]